MEMRFHVEILEIRHEDRSVKELAVYPDVEAKSLEQARIRGLERYEREHPGGDWSLVYGKARPRG